jgi:hypothetical protein
MSIGYGLDVGVGVAIGAEWRPIESFSAGLELRGIAPSKVEQWGSAEPRLQLKATMLTGLLSPCARWKVLMGCAALEAGTVYFDTNPTTWWPRVALGPRVGADVPVGERFSVRVVGDLLFPLLRNQVQPAPSAITFEDPVVSGFVTAGVAVTF